MLSQTGRGREGEAGRSRPTDRPTAVANTIELPPSNVEEVNTSIRSLGTPLQNEIVNWTCGVVSCNFASSPGKIKEFLNSVLIISPLILIQIALSPRMYVAGAGVGVVGGDRDERAEERDGPAERAATGRQPGRLQSAEGTEREEGEIGRASRRSQLSSAHNGGDDGEGDGDSDGGKLGEEGEAVVAAQMELDIRESVAKYRAPWLP